MTTIKNSVSKKTIRKITEKMFADKVINIKEANVEELTEAVIAAVDEQLQFQVKDIIKNPSIIIDNTLTMAGHQLNRSEQKLILIALSKIFLTESSVNEDGSVTTESVKTNANDFLITIKDVQEMTDWNYDKANQFLSDAVYSKDGQYGLATRQIVFNKNSPNFAQVIERIKAAYKRDAIKLKITDRFEMMAPWLVAVQRDEGWVRFSFSDSALEMLPAKEDLKKGNFTSFKLKAILKLDREHSIRLYMLLSMRGELNTFSSTMDELRLILDIPDSYSINDAKKRYITDPLIEINKAFNINLTAKWSPTPGIVDKSLTNVTFTWNARKLHNINSGGTVIKNRETEQQLAIVNNIVNKIPKAKNEYEKSQVSRIQDKLKKVA